MGSGSTFSPNFLIKTFNIHTVEGASCINIGNNAPSGFESYKKQNQGFGSISGDSNTIRGIKSLLNDKALIDMMDGVSGDDMPWMRALLEEKLAELDEDEVDDIDDDGEDDEDEDEDEDEEADIQGNDFLDEFFNDQDDPDDVDFPDEEEDDDEADFDEFFDDEEGPFSRADMEELYNMRKREENE